ncbi:hypothetical protein P171DRAFT_514295 [Karstenula rhodostoma CBS 690.94]|uniref:BTB domain-containing protein n=1 Tax=Karstenula rhodostoma CBS 690.94 TaxID=1392251 RepID=A0A9P4PJ69_9PLEO|nr:hypothetical protein P171DRAFT_514295 [Karstenula rhodostoma CBS 690.94]
MSESFSDLVLSELFTFYVGTGENKDAVRAHSRAIAATCDYMRNLIEGGMKEAHDRTAEQDVELEDFVRFVEYAYRGDYTAPSWVIEVSSAQHEVRVADATQSPNEDDLLAPNVSEPAAEDENAPVTINDSFNSIWGSSAKTDKKKKKVKSKIAVFRTENFNKRNYLPDGDPGEAIAARCAPLPNSAPEENFTPVFLAYARLYSFAEMRLIHQLKALTLYKLHYVLGNFTLYPKRIRDVVELARHTYENTPARTADGTVDELRKLVVDYVACESAEIGKSKEFKELLEEGGEFVSDFWDVVSKHVI